MKDNQPHTILNHAFNYSKPVGKHTQLVKRQIKANDDNIVVLYDSLGYSSQNRTDEFDRVASLLLAFPMNWNKRYNHQLNNN